MRGSAAKDLHEVLSDIIQGRIVKRAKHELRWEGRDVSPDFVVALENERFHATTVQQVDVRPGQRVPAFLIQDGTAYFGWVFWEKFSEQRLRKLFGSVVRNNKGDWAIQISDKRATTIYANPGLTSDMDIDNPSGF